MKTHYVVLGAKGYVGRRFVRFLESKRESVIALSHADIDYTDAKTFEDWVAFNQPRWQETNVFVINCAGKTGRPNVDQCEVKKADTIRLNIVLPAQLSDICDRYGLIFCHVSSGCIYTGSGERVFTENDPPNFAYGNKHYSFYSGSKALAEEYVLKNKKSYVWRIRMPFDERNVERSYLSKLLKYDTLIDATNSLTHLGDFINTTYQMMVKEAPYGLYNLVNEGSITTREIVEIMADKLGITKEFKFFDSIDSFNECVNTPRSNCVISSDKVNGLPNVTPMRPIRDALMDALEKWN